MESEKCKRILVKLSRNDRQHEQKYLQIDVQVDKHQLINLNQVIIDFADRSIIPLKSQVFYLDVIHKLFIYVGDYHQKLLRPARSVLSNNCLTLLCKKPNKISDEALAYPTQQPRKRAKQRTIRDAISSCKQWRRLYHQGLNKQGPIQKLTLDESASRIGISRKTLQDYFKQLRDGCRYKFDFAKHKEQKMGVLRTFVRGAVKLQQPPLEPKKPEIQVESETFHYIELCLAQEKEQPRLMYEQDIGMYLIAEQGYIKNEDSSSSDEPFPYEYQE